VNTAPLHKQPHLLRFSDFIQQKHDICSNRTCSLGSEYILRPGFRPRPTEGTHSAPQTLDGFRGPIHGKRRKGGKRKEKRAGRKKGM